MFVSSVRRATDWSLRFVNDDETVPHSITMRVTDVGTTPGEEAYSVTGRTTAPPAQRNLTASTTLEPGDSETYDSVFTESVWYAIEFTVDDQRDRERRHIRSLENTVILGGNSHSSLTTLSVPTGT